MAHKHWPKDHPYYDRAPVHDMSKAECDVLWRQYQHGHEGEPCVMDIKPGNKTATCTLIGADKRESGTMEQERRQATADAFIEQERRRIAALIGE